MSLVKKEGTIQYGFRKGELMHECFLEHLCMGTARMREDNETDEECTKRGVSMERSKACTNKRSPDGLSLPNQTAILFFA